MVSPPSKYSINVWAGTRVPVNTGVPPSTSGEDVMSGGRADILYEDSGASLVLQAAACGSVLGEAYRRGGGRRFYCLLRMRIVVDAHIPSELFKGLTDRAPDPSGGSGDEDRCWWFIRGRHGAE